MRLTIDNLKDVRTLLYPVRRKWYDIGIELGLKVEELDNIQAADDDNGKCLTMMIKMWLRSINPLPTWKALGDALKAKPVDEVGLAVKGEEFTSPKDSSHMHVASCFSASFAGLMRGVRDI